MLLRTVGCLPGFVVEIVKKTPGESPGRRASIRRRIAVAYCAVAVVTAGLLAGAMMQLWSFEIEEDENLLTAIAQLTDEQTSRTLQNVEQAISNIEVIVEAAARPGTSPSVGAESIEAELRRRVSKRPYLTVLRVLDAQGRAIYSSDTGNSGLDLSDREYFRERRANPGMGLRALAPP